MSNDEQVTFKSLNIHAPIMKAVEEMGFTVPTDIQKQAIPIIAHTEKDFIGQAQTGTGKTAAFAIPLIEKIDLSNPNVQVLVLAPTRELAKQVELEFEKLGKYAGVKSLCIYGGAPYDKQLSSLKKRKPQIVVGTPGRVLDMARRGALKLSKANYCVLDEADEMLNMGFFEDVQLILDMFNEKRQLIMFSATMPRAILGLIKRSFNDYELVKVKNKSLSNDDIEQKYFIVRPRHFREALCRLIDHATDVYAIVFCRTRLETKEVADELRDRGYSLEVLNGDMGQSERDQAMKNFKQKKARLMVCTDVAARGIDVTNLTHVFNYGLPQDNESYVHRIGRTGRAGTKGKAYTIIGPNAAFTIKKIEKHINKTIEIGKLPSIVDLKSQIVADKTNDAKAIFERIKEKGDAYKVDPSFAKFSDEFKDASQEELLKLFFTWTFSNQLKQYDKLSDIETVAADNRSSGNQDRRGRGRRPSRGASKSKPSSGGGGRNYRGKKSSDSSSSRTTKSKKSNPRSSRSNDSRASV